MTQRTPQRKRGWLAILFNIFVPGLGYLYVGEKRQWFSIGILISSVITWAGILAFPIPQPQPGDTLYGLAGLVLLVTFAYDVYQDVQTFNHRQEKTATASAPSSPV